MYNDKTNKAVQKYERNNMKRIVLKFKIEDYNSVIEPVITASGLPTATFIKRAIYEKIERSKQPKE